MCITHSTRRCTSLSSRSIFASTSNTSEDSHRLHLYLSNRIICWQCVSALMCGGHDNCRMLYNTDVTLSLSDTLAL